ncbi:adenosylcobalamin-dependent ribonucleoside-diphosphate reductase [Halomonas organivorans]
MSTSAKDAPAVEEVPMQAPSLDIWDTKYRLKDRHGRPVDADLAATRERVARALAAVEGEAADAWLPKFRWALDNGAIPAGRIVANAGAEHVKPEVSLINCTVSRTIRDSMRDILEAVVDAGMTLKAGCVSPDTWVVTERGVVSAEQAVRDRHERMLCYDREANRFEMRPVERHMTTHVPREENIELVSNGVSLKTSVRHPVLVHRDGKLMYVPAGEVIETDGLVHHTFPWSADNASALRAWFAGAHLGDGSAYEKPMDYRPTRSAWAARARAAGTRLIFKIRAAEREVVERYASFFQEFCGSQARVMANSTPNGTPVWDYTVASFPASRAAELIDDQIGKKTWRLQVPRWIMRHPERHFLPFLAGLIDTDGTVCQERGSVTIAAQSGEFLMALKGLLGLFGVNAGLTRRRSREHRYQGHLIRDAGGFMLKISDSAFLKCIAQYMADTEKRRRIHDCASQSGMYDHYQLTPALRDALTKEAEGLSHRERQVQGFYHGYHRRDVISRVWLDRWEERFPRLKPLLDFARCLRPVETITRGLDIGETFYDFTVEGHHNYLAGSHGLMVIHNCGIGYEFSTLRHKGAFVFGAGAGTNGPLAFMDIYDKMCFTVASAGGRRGAQMATFDVGHPDVRAFIEAKREAGRLRQFNLSLLITDEFMEAVRADADWSLAFPLHPKEKDDVEEDELVYRDWPVIEEGYTLDDQGRVACRIVEVVRARELWDTIMRSTYDFAEPGFILIDQVNRMNNNWFCEEIRATNPCGEQPLPPEGACLLGSINLTRFVLDPFGDTPRFDWERYRQVVAIFTRMLDNVVEISGLPLEGQRREIEAKRRHGMGFLGLGSALTMLKMPYGSPESLAFTEEVSRVMAVEGWKQALELSREKGMAPILAEDFAITPKMLRERPELASDGYAVGDRLPGRLLHARYSRYMQKVAEVEPELVAELAEHGARFTHHSSIAPTGTISLSLGNNASNGIEPSFSHRYYRNVIRAGRKTKDQVEVVSFELAAYRHLVAPEAVESELPDYFVTADAVSPAQHVAVQAAAQAWVDSAISKTVNVPTDFAFADFKDLYLDAYDSQLKGCTTFRFNPEAFQGVLVREDDLKNTTYVFELENGETVELAGDEKVLYEGEEHTAANLYEGLKEGTYGKW